MTRRRLFVWLLPLLWGAGSLLGFAFPGDEYGLFLLGSLAGLWAVALTGNDGSPASLLVPILACGAGVMVGLGLLLDLARASLPRWLALTAIVATVAAVVLLSPYPNLREATQKNGSVTAYITCAWQLGSYAASVLVLCATLVRRVARRAAPGASEAA